MSVDKSSLDSITKKGAHSGEVIVHRKAAPSRTKTGFVLALLGVVDSNRISIHVESNSPSSGSLEISRIYHVIAAP